jgi:hypothetical protein
MRRQTWCFEYAGSKLADATQKKVTHHRSRFEWWRNKKQEILDKVRAEGLEIDERISLQYSAPRARDWEGGAQVLIRNDLQINLDECLQKLAYHTEKLRDYEGWLEMLQANPDERFRLDHDDWLFFFGKS